MRHHCVPFTSACSAHNNRSQTSSWFLHETHCGQHCFLSFLTNSMHFVFWQGFSNECQLTEHFHFQQSHSANGVTKQKCNFEKACSEPRHKHGLMQWTCITASCDNNNHNHNQHKIEQPLTKAERLTMADCCLFRSKPLMWWATSSWMDSNFSNKTQLFFSSVLLNNWSAHLYRNWICLKPMCYN